MNQKIIPKNKKCASPRAGHIYGVNHGVPFGSIPPQYRDTSRGNNWRINDSVSDSIGMQGEKDGLRRAYGSNGELLPRGWAYKPF